MKCLLCRDRDTRRRAPVALDPVSDLIGTLAVLEQGAVEALPAGLLGAVGNAGVGIAVSRNISIGGIH
jgi:hypothetical protein